MGAGQALRGTRVRRYAGRGFAGGVRVLAVQCLVGYYSGVMPGSV